jgi:hypothetical protein
MEYNQFRQLLQLKGIREKETVSQLEDFIEKFPYCQTSRLLLAKALHDQDSIHYDRSLKLAAAYAPNREVLRNLVGVATQETEYEFPLPVSSTAHYHPDSYREPVPETGIDSETTAPVSGLSSAEKKEERFEQWYSEDEISGRAFIDQKEKEKLVDPHEMIRQRLSEILSDVVASSPGDSISDVETKDQKIQSPEPDIKPAAAESQTNTVETEELKEPVSDNIQSDIRQEIKPVQETSVGSLSEKKIIAEAEHVKDDLDKMELEHAMEESILESLAGLPVIAPEKNFGEVIDKISSSDSFARKSPEADRSSPRSFTDWLKMINPSSSGFEEVHAPSQKPSSKHEENLPEEAVEPDSHLSDDELIEKFLIEDPKIVPSKSEFYSPVNQAKKSVMDHDDVVSETLASIYLSQGNTSKARWCYEKLILLHPEKSAFFAALLKEIDDQPNNKEDL